MRWRLTGKHNHVLLRSLTYPHTKPHVQCTHAYAHVFTHYPRTIIHTHTHIHAYSHTHIFIHPHTPKHIHTYAHNLTHTHTYPQGHTVGICKQFVLLYGSFWNPPNYSSPPCITRCHYTLKGIRIILIVNSHMTYLANIYSALLTISVWISMRSQIL